jgi:hypothetical protein
VTSQALDQAHVGTAISSSTVAISGIAIAISVLCLLGAAILLLLRLRWSRRLGEDGGHEMNREIDGSNDDGDIATSIIPWDQDEPAVAFNDPIMSFDQTLVMGDSYAEDGFLE